MNIRIIFACLVCVSFSFIVAEKSADAKSMYVVADHHTGQFDAWDIQADGRVVYQETYNLVHAQDPAGVVIWDDPDPLVDKAVLFITSEFDQGVEVVDAITMTSLGSITAGLPNDLAGIEVHDEKRPDGMYTVYSLLRASNYLYIFDWNPSNNTLTEQPGSPVSLPGCIEAFGIALDESRNLIYVADVVAGSVKVYDIATWSRVNTITLSLIPIDIAIDRVRGFLYGVTPDGSCAGGQPPSQSNLLCQYNLATETERAVDKGRGGMGLAVDELSGYVYVTEGCNDGSISVWDPSSNPFTEVQRTADIGNPAGIAIGNVSFNPLRLSKDDGVGNDDCIIGREEIHYEICYENSGNNFDVYNVEIIDTFSYHTNFIWANEGGIDNGDGTVSWDIGTLPAASPKDCVQLITKVADAPPSIAIVNFATIKGDEIGQTTVATQTDICECMLIVPDDYPTIQEAIDAALDWNVICVHDGIYTGANNKNLDFGGKIITVRSINGSNDCIIDCEGDGRGFIFDDGETSDSVAQGFTLINSSSSQNGGGIYCINNSSPTIDDFVIKEASASQNGGGIYIADSSPVIKKSIINTCSAGISGGGIYAVNSSANISNCTIVGGSASTSGAGVSCVNSSPDIAHCTISDNTAGAYGGAILGTQSSSPNMVNCILWGNSAVNGPEIALGSSEQPSSLDISYSDVEGGINAAHVEPGCAINWDITNIDSDPLFLSGEDYHLQNDSPCMDTGRDAGVYTDIDNNGRPAGAGFDMGSDEFFEPWICVEPEQLHIVVWRGRNAEDQSFTVTNCGFQTLYYEIDDNVDWLACDPVSGGSVGESDPITVHFNTAWLPLGNYAATITVSDISGSGFPREIPVSLDVLAAEIACNVTSLSNTSIFGNDAPQQTFEVWNSGAFTLSFMVGDDVDWMYCSPSSSSSTGEPVAITVHYSTYQLAVGRYTAPISIIDPEAINSPQYIDVELTVKEPPLTTINLILPADKSYQIYSPPFQWEPIGGGDNFFAVDFLLYPAAPPGFGIGNLGLPSIYSPAASSFFWSTYSHMGIIIKENTWSMPTVLWDRIPSGSQLYWRVRGIDLDADQPAIINSNEVRSLFKM